MGIWKKGGEIDRIAILAKTQNGMRENPKGGGCNNPPPPEREG